MSCSRRKFIFLGTFAKLRKATINFFMSVLLSTWNNKALIGRILMKLYIWTSFAYLSRKFELHYNFTQITDILQEDVPTFTKISRWKFSIMSIVWDKNSEKNTYFMFSNFFSLENRGVYEKISKILVDTERLQMRIWWRVLCWIRKTTRAETYATARAPTPITKRARTHIYALINAHTV